MKELRLGFGHIKDEELTYRSSSNQVVHFLLTKDKKRLSMVYQTKLGKYDWIDLDKSSTATLGGKLLGLSQVMRNDENDNDSEV